MTWTQVGLVALGLLVELVWGNWRAISRAFDPGIRHLFDPALSPGRILQLPPSYYFEPLGQPEPPTEPLIGPPPRPPEWMDPGATVRRECPTGNPGTR